MLCEIRASATENHAQTQSDSSWHFKRQQKVNFDRLTCCCRLLRGKWQMANQTGLFYTSTISILCNICRRTKFKKLKKFWKKKIEQTKQNENLSCCFLLIETNFCEKLSSFNFPYVRQSASRDSVCIERVRRQACVEAVAAGDEAKEPAKHLSANTQRHRVGRQRSAYRKRRRMLENRCRTSDRGAGAETTCVALRTSRQM